MAKRKKFTPSIGKITPLSGEFIQDQESKNFLDLEAFVSSPRPRSPKSEAITNNKLTLSPPGYILKRKSPDDELSISPCKSEGPTTKFGVIEEAFSFKREGFF